MLTIFGLRANFSLRVCLAVCLIFQWFSAWRAYKLRAYKKKMCILSRDNKSTSRNLATRFLDASSHLYNSLCRSVAPSFRPSVTNRWKLIFFLFVILLPFCLSLYRSLSVCISLSLCLSGSVCLSLLLSFFSLFVFLCLSLSLSVSMSVCFSVCVFLKIELYARLT